MGKYSDTVRRRDPFYFGGNVGRVEIDTITKRKR